MRWFTSRFSPIGIDVGSHSVKAAQIAHESGGLRLTAGAVFPLPGGDFQFDVAAAIEVRNALRDRGFHGRRIVLVAGEAAFGAFDRAGFKIAALDTAACALLRACRPIMQGEFSTDRDAAMDVIVHLGHSNNLCILCAADRMLSQRHLTAGGSRLTHESLVDEFDLSADAIDQLLKEVCVDDQIPAAQRESVHAAWTRDYLIRHADMMASEIRECVSAARARDPSLRLNRVLLTGGVAQTKGLAGCLSARLHAQVVTARPQHLAKCDRALDPIATPGLVPAIGLALWEH